MGRATGFLHALGNLGIRLGVLLMDIPFPTLSRPLASGEYELIRQIVRPGDLILTCDQLFPLWRLFLKITANSRYGHLAIYEGEGRVIEATTFHPSGLGVARTELPDYLGGYKKICVLRPDYKGQADPALAFARAQLGKAYDYAFQAEGEETMYCSKLVAKCLQAAGLTVPTRHLLGARIYFPDDFINEQNRLVFQSREQTDTALWPLLLLLGVQAVLNLGLGLAAAPQALLAALSLLPLAAFIGWGLFQLKIMSRRLE